MCNLAGSGNEYGSGDEDNNYETAIIEGPYFDSGSGDFETIDVTVIVTTKGPVYGQTTTAIMEQTFLP